MDEAGMTVAEREQLFVDFARLKLAADGSDSYINGAVWSACYRTDPYFYLAAFTTFYAPPAQDAFSSVWCRDDLIHRPEVVEEWVVRHWKRIPLSRARRTNAFTSTKVIKALRGAALEITDASIARIGESGNFDQAFRELLKVVPYHGRYTGLKLYESLRRVGAPLPVVSNVVPRGGKTPRKGLHYIYGHDYRSNEPALLEEANALADGLRQMIPTTWFNVEMLLCNFTKAVKGGYYPGHALDRDLSRIPAVAEAFGSSATRLLTESRQALYPRECLGEFNGWTGTRKECERCYPENGYLWSDLLYDFRETSAMSLPQTRGGLTTARGFLPPPVLGYGEEAPV